MTVFDSVVESKNITTIYAMHQKLLNMPCRNDTEQFYLLEILFIYILVFVIYFSSLSLSKLKYEILFFHHNMEINHTLGFHGKFNLQFRYFNSLISWILFQVVWVEVQINFIAKLHIIDWAIIPHVFLFEDLRIFGVYLQT